MNLCERCERSKASDDDWDRPHDDQSCGETCWCRCVCWGAEDCDHYAIDWREEALRLRTEVAAMRGVMDAARDWRLGGTAADASRFTAALDALDRLQGVVPRCDGKDCLDFAGGHHPEDCIIRDSAGIAVQHDDERCGCRTA